LAIVSVTRFGISMSWNHAPVPGCTQAGLVEALVERLALVVEQLQEVGAEIRMSRFWISVPCASAQARQVLVGERLALVEGALAAPPGDVQQEPAADDPRCAIGSTLALSSPPTVVRAS
jgi:hypothetical protein